MPSLSTVGSEVLDPKNLSSKVSNAASAAVCAVSAAVFAVSAAVLAVSAPVLAVSLAVFAVSASFLCVSAVEALAALAVAEFAAAVALAAAAVCELLLMQHQQAMTIFALSVFVVNGCEPEEVCAVLQIKILLVDVSLTKSLAL